MTATSPDSNDTFTILSTSAAKWWKTDLKKLVGKVPKWAEILHCFIFYQTEF